MPAILYCNIVFILLCYLIGSGFNLFLIPPRKNYYFECLENIFWGLILLVSFFSVVITRFHTINVIIVLFIVYWIMTNRNKKVQGRRFFDRRALLLALLASVVFVVLQVVFLFRFKNILSGNFDIQYPDLLGFPDFAFYADAADSMLRYGLEGVGIDLFERKPASFYNVPYHYFDLWINSLLQYVFPFSKATVFTFLFKPFAYTLSFLSVATVMNEIKKVNYFWTFIFSFLLLFPLTGLRYSAVLPNTTIIEFPKLLISYVCVALSICYFKNGELRNGFVVACLMPVCNVLAAPPVLLTVFLIGVFLLRRNRGLAVEAMLISVFTLIAIVLFYLFAGNIYFYSSTHNDKFIYHKIARVRPAEVDIWYQYTGYVLRFSFLSLAIIFALNFRPVIVFLKKEKKLLLSLIMVYVLGLLLSWAGSSYHADGAQMKFFPADILPYFVLALLMPVILSAKNLYKKTVSVSLLIAAFSYSLFAIYHRQFPYQYAMSVAFKKDVNSILPPHSTVAFVYNDENLLRPYAYKQSVVYEGLHFPLELPGNIKMVSLCSPLSADSIAYKTLVQPSEIINSPFYRFVQQRRLASADKHWYEHAFLVHYNIRYLVLDKGLDTVSFYRNLGTVVCKDPVSQISLLECKL